MLDVADLAVQIISNDRLILFFSILGCSNSVPRCGLQSETSLCVVVFYQLKLQLERHVSAVNGDGMASCFFAARAPSDFQPSH